MRYVLPSLISLCLLVACGHEEASHGAAPASQPVAGVQTVEIACAGCVFKMPDAKGCEPAVKIDGKAMKVTGVAFDAHGAGLCDGAKKAEISGNVVDGTYVASSLKVVP